MSGPGLGLALLLPSAVTATCLGRFSYTYAAYDDDCDSPPAPPPAPPGAPGTLVNVLTFDALMAPLKCDAGDINACCVNSVG